MKCNMNDLNPGTWFDFQVEVPTKDKDGEEDGGTMLVPDADGGRIFLRVASSAFMDKLRRETFETSFKMEEGKRISNVEIDHEKRDRMIWDYCIIDWEKLFDDEGSPIECNSDNKVKLMTEHNNFAAFCENCFTKLNKINEAYKEYLEKN